MRGPARSLRRPARRIRAAQGFDAVTSYRVMVRMRLVEEGLARAWADGLVPGEYHAGIGEEAINAGVIGHLRPEDTLALDHRNTAPMIARGADPGSLVLEVLGSEDGMNRGWAGHMHLLAPDLRAASDGIVGSSAPLAVGHAIAHRALRPGAVAVAFHGEAAMNQGMLMEAYNLAAAWVLPVVFVCKDNQWSITTRTADVTGGSATARAQAFGLAVEDVRGDRIEVVHAAAGRLISRARDGGGPAFLHVTCHRPGGHFEGDGLVRLLRTPLTMTAAWAPGLTDAASAADGGSTRQRTGGLGEITRRGALAARDWTVGSTLDPIRSARTLLDATVADRIEAEERAGIEEALAAARATVLGRRVFGGTRGVTR